MHRFLLAWASLFMLINSVFGQSLQYDPALQPFYHGVASGDPLSDRVIIWTRITPDEGVTDQIDVAWKVATDSAMVNIVQSGVFTTNTDRDYTVKVDVTDLQPYTTYFYRFEAEEATSLTGRTRTAPSTNEADRLRFAVVSCSNYQAGYFSAYEKVAERADLDAVIHLGDYIYEYSATGEDFYGDEELRRNRSHLPDKELVTLEDYRTRYAQYRLDPDLRAVHQQHPFITIWDDHESANDGYKDGAQNHQPETEGPWEVRKSVSKQAYAEWLPIRVDVEEKPLYRTIHYGNLVDLIMLDTRLEERDRQEMSVTSPELYLAERTILGNTQKQWLYEQITTSEAHWKVIGNQVIFSPFNVWFAGLDPNGGFTTEGIESTFLDIWDGYPTERNEIIDFMDSSNLDNIVILTGDFHSSFAFDVTAQPSPLSGSDPAIAVARQVPVPVTPTYDPSTRSGSVAVEFATPSINSANFDENIGAEATRGFEAQINQPLPATVPTVGGINPNPHMRYNDLDEHGYFILDVAEGRAQANWYYVNTIREPVSDEYFAAAWGANNGETFLTEGEENSPKVFPGGADSSRDSTLSVTRFVLVDPATDQDVGVLMDGDTIDLTVLSEGFDVRAIVAGATESVRFSLNDTLIRVENVPPYTLFVQQGSDYIGQKPAVGLYHLTATPFTQDRAQGRAGNPLMVNVVVTDKTDEPAPMTIVEIASQTDELSILAQAIQRAGLTETLNGEGLFTVFAPTNQAFEELLYLLHLHSIDQLPRFILKQLLLLHVAKGSLTSDILENRSTVNTLVGLPLFVRGDSSVLQINNAKVKTADIRASNGVVHVVDAVILPDLLALLGTNERRITALGKSLIPEDGPLHPALTLSAFPNPGTDEVTMQLEGLAGETLSVRVIDPQGRYIAQQQYTVVGPKDTFTLEVGQFGNGIYIVNAQVGELYEYVRLTK